MGSAFYLFIYLNLQYERQQKYVDTDLNEDKLLFNGEFGLRVSGVTGNQLQQSFSLVEPFAECRQLSVKLHLVVCHRVEAGSLGVAGRRVGDSERDGVHAAARHCHRL